MPKPAPLLLACPHCFTTLRLRDRSFLRKRVACPECSGAILLSPDPTHGVVGQVAAEKNSGAVVAGILETEGPAAAKAPAGLTASGGPAHLTPAASHVARKRTGTAPRQTPGHAAAASPKKKSARPAAPAAAAESAPAAAVAPPQPKPTLRERVASTKKRVQTPAGVAWVITAILCAAIVVVAASRPGSSRQTPAATVPPRDNAPVPSGAGGGAVKPAVSSDNVKVETPAEAETRPGGANPEPDPANVAEAPGVPVPPAADAVEPAVAEVPDELPRIPNVAAFPKGPPKPPIDVAARLKQPITKFETPRAVPLKELFLIVEEMIGVPVRFEGENPEPPESLSRATTISLQNTTVGAILQSLVDKGELAWEIRGEEIRLRTK